jgi:benzoate-CoA ligase
MSSAAPILLPDEFNAASYFVDRHIEDGRPDKVAIECGEVQVTYRQLFERVNQVGNGLRTLGVRIEERVFLLLLDSPGCRQLRCHQDGAVPVPVNTLLKSADYEYLLNNSRARVAIVSDSLVASIEAIPRQQLRYLETIIVVRGEFRTGSLSFEKLVRESSSVLQAESTGKDDAAFWLYSSGSTGQPKACVHLQHDMVVSSERYAKSILNITDKDRCFSVAKLFFAYGLGNALYFPLAVGATSILLPGSPKPQSVFEVIERQRPTLFFSVPSNYVKLLAHTAPDGKFDLSSVRHAISAGRPCRPCFSSLQRAIRVEILDAIGRPKRCTWSSPMSRVLRGLAEGKIIPGFDARIVDDNNQPVAGEIGNLLVKSDSTCAYYWNQHQKTKDTIEGHWIRTGDKYYQDEDGYFGTREELTTC